MNRLTNEYSILETIDKIQNDITFLKEVALRFAAYEDTGLEPEEIKDLKECVEGEEGTQGTVKDLIELMQYRKLESQGLLIKLPCKVKDTVYVDAMTFGTNDDIAYAEAEVISIRITKKQTFLKLRIFALGLDGMPYGCSNYPVSSFGKTVFLTREEAEKALEDK